jgi:hypothetical protein
MIAVEVTAYVDSIPIESLCHQQTDHTWPEMEVNMAEDSPRARVEVGETVGGPDFSSVRVHVSIETPYNPAKHKVEDIANKLYEKGLELIDSFIEPSYKGLLRHLETLHKDE